ncbi:MAG: hypothetical protein JWR50_3190, partial [Mucilaginibacter sp.]|nr:hypothetical protein [Mucilaginibacter sp.]
NKIRLADVPVKFRYDHKDGYLLIPVIDSYTGILTVIFTIFLAILIGFTVYLISSFIGFVVDTSKGEIFTAKNVKRLRFIALTLFAFPILSYGLNYAMKCIFYDYFIPGIVVKDNLVPGLKINLVLLIIFLLLYKTFRQGKQLKDEHDLTV